MSYKYNKDYCCRIAKKLVKAGKNQNDIAKYLKVSVSTISSWKRAHPEFGLIMKDIYHKPNISSSFEINRINWKQIFDDLAEKGVGPSFMSRILKIPITTISYNYTTGAEPAYSIGVAVLDVHTMVCKTK